MVRYIGLGDDSHQPVAPIDHKNVPHLMRFHSTRCLFEIIVLARF